jgi:hypothetical protein
MNTVASLIFIFKLNFPSLCKGLTDSEIICIIEEVQILKTN